MHTYFNSYYLFMATAINSIMQYNALNCNTYIVTNKGDPFTNQHVGRQEFDKINLDFDETSKDASVILESAFVLLIKTSFNQHVIK